MTGIRLELANPHRFASPDEYIEKHLAPIATEMHRLLNEMVAPGSTAEECAVDMVPDIVSSSEFRVFNRNRDSEPKGVEFDGSLWDAVSKETLRSKQLKVQLSAVVYVDGPGVFQFVLVDESGVRIETSLFAVGDGRDGTEPAGFTRVLPFGDQPGLIRPDKRRYYLAARRIGGSGSPVCRRFSLSFIYI